MSSRRQAVFAALAALLGAAASAAAAYPERPVTVVVPFAAGGTTDVIARIMADYMSRTLGQQFVVENVTGAGGTIGAARVAKANPDGYTLLMGNLGTQAASVGLYPKLPYDPRADFEPVINSGATPMVIAAKKDLPVKDFREFVAHVKANGAKLNYGTGGVGATSHLTCIYLSSLLGAEPQHIPFRGSGPALNALIAGQIDYVCDQTAGIVPQIQGGEVKGLVVAVQNRVPVIPDVPTSAEQGLPQFQASGWNALFAPKGARKEIVDRLNAAGQAALKDEGVRKRLLDLGSDIPKGDGRGQAALAAHVKAEVDRWTPIIKAAGVEAK